MRPASPSSFVAGLRRRDADLLRSTDGSDLRVRIQLLRTTRSRYEATKPATALVRIRERGVQPTLLPGVVGRRRGASANPGRLRAGKPFRAIFPLGSRRRRHARRHGDVSCDRRRPDTPRGRRLLRTANWSADCRTGLIWPCPSRAGHPPDVSGVAGRSQPRGSRERPANRRCISLAETGSRRAVATLYRYVA